MSSDTRDEDVSDDDATRAGEKATVPPPQSLFDDENYGDYGDDEATVMARIPDELIAESALPAEGKGGLKQMFSREGAHAPHAPPRPSTPADVEGDALLDMLFDDARDDHKAATPVAPPPRPAAPPPRPSIPTATPRIPAPSIPAPNAITARPSRPAGPTTARPHADSVAPDRLIEPTRDEETPEPPKVSENETETVDLHPSSLDEGALMALSTPPPDDALSMQMPPSKFEREEDASALLLRQQQRDAWVARAEWLRNEAEASTDPAARARSLLVVSELYAMAGEEATARTIAEAARQLAPTSPLAHRQVRGLLTRDGDWQGVLDVLDTETRASTTPDARCHGSLLGAEIARVCLSDDDGVKKRTDQAHRVLPSDPRSHLTRFCDALALAEPEEGAPSPVTKVKILELPELGALPAAVQHVLAHRGLSPATSIAGHVPRAARTSSDNGPVTAGAPVLAPPGSAYEALLRVRAAAATSDHVGVVEGLATLSRSPSLTGGARWLEGALAAVRSETRSASVEAFRALASGTHGPLALRALAARAIELGDPEAARSATEAAGEEAFSAADRIALAALAGGGRDAIEPWLDAVLGDPELAAIATSALAAMGGPHEDALPTVGGARARTATTLGRALAAKDGLREAIAAFTAASPEDAVARALSLELAIEDGDGRRVARALSDWRDDTELERERATAGALVAEIVGDIERAREEYERVRAVDPGNEAVARASAALSDPEGAAKIMGEHAQALDGGPRAAVLAVEAAVRLTGAGDADAADALLRRAAAADPDLALAHHLGERAARGRGDRDALVEWIRSRREASQDPIEQAHDLVREALLMSDGDASAGATLLESALRARPGDVSLREIYERLAPEPPADRAAWRAARAAETSGVEAARLWLDAALELERSGDLEGAAQAAQKAVAAGESMLAPIAAYRAAVAGHGAGDVVDQLLPKARETTDAVERLEIYERLAELDERGRGDAASGLLWRRTILDETPGHLPTLRRVASTLIGASRDEELEPIALEIARALEGPESVAHAMLAARLHQRIGTWDETREAVELAYKHQPRSVWALRQMASHARTRGENALALECERTLIERTNRPSEAAALSLRAAQSALKANLVEDALAFLEHAINLVPQHLVAHLDLASALEQNKNHAGAATALEAAASVCASPAERARLLYRAALLWTDEVDDMARARQALEQVSEIDPAYEDVFQRLQTIYVANGARAELAALLERRLVAVTDPAERVEMEVLRGRALADVGDAATAKRALAAALDANPEHVEALAAFGDVCAAEQDWGGAEQAWIRLARLVPDPDKQSAIYLRLGALYDEHMPNPERAELAYQEILKRSPTDSTARERLVALYQKMGDSTRAIEQQTLLVNAAEAPEDKCARTTQLAAIFEAIGDDKRAEATLLSARKTWPKDDVALGALARFYLRHNQAQAANALLDRAVADARRALGTGRFEPYLFSTIAAVASLRSRPDAARVAKAAVAVLDGGDAALDGAGVGAADPTLDDLLAPDVVTPAFRELLKRTGPLLDTAVAFDLQSVRATPLPPQLASIGELIRGLGAGYGLPGVQVFTSTVLGPVCIPVSTHPPIIVLGHALLTSPRDDVKGFLIHRALKILQANASAISRTAPIDLWPLLAAYLKGFNPTWIPQGVDQGKLTDFYGRVSRFLPKGVDPQLALLSADVIGSIGNRASTLNTVINGWGNRAGLLAVGDLNVAISGIAWAGGHANAPPAVGKERMTWIGRNAEARELVVFSVSDAYSDARARLGLGSDEPGANHPSIQPISGVIEEVE